MSELASGGLLLVVTLYLGALVLLFGPPGSSFLDGVGGGAGDDRRRIVHQTVGFALLVSTAVLVAMVVAEWLVMEEQLRTLELEGRNVDSEPGIAVLEAMSRIFLMGGFWLLVAAPLLVAWRRTRRTQHEERAHPPW